MLLAEPDLPRIGSLVADDHEFGVAAREPDLDAPRVELTADLEGRLAEEIEEVEVQRGCERLGHTASRLCWSHRRREQSRREFLLDRLDMARRAAR